MTPNVAIDSFVSKEILKDVSTIVKDLVERKGKPRVVYLPYSDLSDVINKLVVQHPYPFCPTLCGIPVDFGTDREISVLGVWDDNTNTDNQVEKEIEIWQPSSLVH